MLKVRSRKERPGKIPKDRPPHGPGCHFENQSRSIVQRDMDETLSSIYAKADALRRQIDDGSFEGVLQVLFLWLGGPLMFRRSSKNAFQCLSGVSSLSTN
jgi:hypothetical protein